MLNFQSFLCLCATGLTATLETGSRFWSRSDRSQSWMAPSICQLATMYWACCERFWPWKRVLARDFDVSTIDRWDLEAKKQSICSYQQIEPIKLESQNLFAIPVWVGWSYHGARALYQLFANCIVCSSFVRLWRRLDTQWNISSSLVEIFQTELTNSWSVRWSHPFHKS